MRTTTEQFELFVEECKKWQEYWGLTDWVIDYAHTEIIIPDGTQPASTTTAGREDKYAIIAFNTEVPANLLTLKEIASAAFHEMSEMLMMDLFLLAQARFDVSQEDLTMACHSIIGRLTNTVFADYWEQQT